MCVYLFFHISFFLGFYFIKMVIITKLCRFFITFSTLCDLFPDPLILGMLYWSSLSFYFIRTQNNKIVEKLNGIILTKPIVYSLARLFLFIKERSFRISDSVISDIIMEPLMESSKKKLSCRESFKRICVRLSRKYEHLLFANLFFDYC